uniref:IRS-type PTB domain-containing protein n=1 Tax=Mola mola TaxID=94237 RepID=A0A3Q3W6K3_MOLML
MGSCLSCPEKESIPDNHQSKFKVINVDDDGNELGSGVMELTDSELVLHTHRRDDVRWPYLCLRRYGYDSNLFSFESGRRCQTGQGIFAFKCSRAEEIFNMLQEVMHSHSISVVEEAVVAPNDQLSNEIPRFRQLTALGYSVPTVPNGVTRIPSVGEPPSHPSTRHPSVASTRLPSVGEESTHPLLVAEEAVHTYVNTTGLLEEQPSPLTPEPQVLLEPQGVRFVLGPTPVQRQLMEKEKRQQEAKEAEEPPETNGSTEAPAGLEPAPLLSNGSSSNPSTAPRRHRPPPLTPDLQNVNNSAQRRTALLDYENLPALPPVWEARKPSSEDDENGCSGLKTPSLNGYNHHSLHHSYSHPLSARTAAMSNLQKARPRDDGTSRKTRHNSTELPTKSTA